MILTKCLSGGCTEVGFEAKAIQVCNKIDVLLSTYMLTAELGCLLPWVDGWLTPATELSDAGVSLAMHKLGWCRWEQFEQLRLESQFLAMWERLRQMKQRPCFLMSFLSPTFVTTTQSTDLWSCLRKVHVTLWGQQCIDSWWRGLVWVFSLWGRRGGHCHWVTPFPGLNFCIEYLKQFIRASMNACHSVGRPLNLCISNFGNFARISTFEAPKMTQC